ncbi:MAG: hypothetical protein WBW76_17265 [Candidatus Cybelea sp.]
MRAALFTQEAIKQLYLAGAHDPTAIDPDNWVIDDALMDRLGVKDIMLDMFYGIRKDHEIFPDLRQFSRTGSHRRSSPTARTTRFLRLTARKNIS